MKKDKLYTVNKHNKAQFARGVDRVHHNIFDGLFGSTLTKPSFYSGRMDTPSQRMLSVQESKNLVNNFRSSTPTMEPKLFNNKGITGNGDNTTLSGIFSALSGQGGTGFGSGGGGGFGGMGGSSDASWLSALPGMGEGFTAALNNEYSTDANNGFSALDTALAGGKRHKAGMAGVNTGAAMLNAGLKEHNPKMVLAGGIAGTVGTIVNHLWGSELNDENIKAVENNIEDMQRQSNEVASANTNETLRDALGNIDMGYDFTQDYIGKDGKWGHEAKDTFNDLFLRQQNARWNLRHAIASAAKNVNKTNDSNVIKHFSAFGGPLEQYNDNMGAIGYGFMSDYLTQKKKETEVKNKMTGISPMPTMNTFGHGGCFNPFALGGDVQMHGADFTNGLISINAGSSHEQNPNEGVQLGVDPEGTPNLVEEGETVFDDYVYSNRILADAQTKEKFGLPRKKDITFADISKKLEKESSERPNDPISQAGLKAQMHQLADEQERQKQEMDAQRAKAAFEALSPEEQVAVMEGAAQQEAMAEQAAIQQLSPEEIAIAQQQQAMADGSQAALGQEPQMMAEGGKINRFDNGGKAYTKMLNSLGFHTQSEFEKWAEENGIDFGDLWKNNPNTLNNAILSDLWKNEKFKEALKKKNPALFHAFDTKGYDFGAYQPTNTDRATIQSISKGNWKATNGQGWFGSEDLAFKQATEGLSDAEIKALTTEQLAERMAKTDAYKNTSKWLENSDNALMYLNTLINDPDTPEVAKKHALQYVKDGKWKDGYTYNYNGVFGKVRATNPGTYWHTAMEANRGNEANNFVINEDGSIEPILGNVPTDWTSAGNYSWADENSDYTYNYYKRPAVVAKPEVAKTPEEKKAEEEKGVAPKHRAEWLRYAGLFGPAVGLGMMAAGIGRPDTAQLDAAVAGAGDVNTADWKPLGNYLTYRPLDIWFEQNRLNANARATDRAIMNNAAPIGTKMAGLLASGYNDQIASGNLFRQDQEYNDNLRKQVAEFNRGTDQFNSEQYGATSRFNADAYNNARRANAQLRLQAAAQKMDADAGWYNSLYGNVAGLFKGIGDIGTENFRMNRIGEMAARGDFGTATDETYGFEPYLTRSNRKSKKNR